MATLQDYYNQLAPIYEPQIASLKAQQAALPAQYTAQKSALEQARINAFRNISNTASARGMAFSGFTPEQEAQYTGTTYMPAMANLETQQLKGKQSLIDAINAANADRYAKSLGYYESAQQAEAANAAKIEAARIKATAPADKTPSITDITRNVASQISIALQNAAGVDGYVSPRSYSDARKDWVSQGLSSKAFDEYFAGFRNPYAEDIESGNKRSKADYGVY